MRTARLGVRGRSRHKNNSEIVIINLDEKNVGKKRKSLKQGLTSAKGLTMKLTREETQIVSNK